MGFRNKFKDAAEQAQQAAKSAAGIREPGSGEIVVNVDPDDPQSMLVLGLSV